MHNAQLVGTEIEFDFEISFSSKNIRGCVKFWHILFLVDIGLP
jgi:hypothetical protein